MTETRKIARPAIARALDIYGAVARRGCDLGTRKGLARHVLRLCACGERNQGRLTVHGLSYLRTRDLNREAFQSEDRERKRRAS
jgi:hypothetical protein